jgi:hypothetical protein
MCKNGQNWLFFAMLNFHENYDFLRIPCLLGRVQVFASYPLQPIERAILTVNYWSKIEILS